MFRFQSGDGFQILHGIGDIGSWYGKNKIQVDVMKSGFPSHFHIPANLFRRMDSPQIPEPPVIHALNAHGQPIDAGIPISCQTFFR